MPRTNFCARIEGLVGANLTAEDARVLATYLRARLTDDLGDGQEGILPLCYDCGGLATYQYRKESRRYVCDWHVRDYEAHDFNLLPGAMAVAGVQEILLRGHRKEVPE